jgi:hypothetical protein
MSNLFYCKYKTKNLLTIQLKFIYFFSIKKKCFFVFVSIYKKNMKNNSISSILISSYCNFVFKKIYAIITVQHKNNILI